MLRSPYALGTRTELWFGHGCSADRMLSEHERNYGLGMDALVIVCSSNTNGSMVWAWMLWSPYALPTRTEAWFGHGCSGQRMLFQHERNYGLGIDALVTVCSSNTIGIMVWAWMLWSPYALGTRTELWFAWACFAASRSTWIRAFEGFGSQAHGVRGFVGSWGSRVRRAAEVRGCRWFAVFVGSQGSRVCKFTDAGSRVRGFAGSRARGFGGSQVRGFAGSRVRGFAGARVRGFAGSRVHGFAGSRVRRFAGSRVRGCTGSQVRGFAGSRVHGFAGARVRGFAGSRVHGFAGSRVRGFAGSQVRGFAGSRVRGCTGSQVRGFTGSRVHGFAGSRVRGFAGSRVRGFAGSRVRGFAGSRVHGFAGSRVRGSAGSRVRGFARFARIPRAIMFMSAVATHST